MHLKILACILVFGPFAPPASAKEAGKRPKVKWKSVQVVDKPPADCEQLGKVDGEALRLEPFSTNKGLKERAVKSLKKKTAKLGGNTLVVTDKDASAWNADAQGTAYWCDALPSAKDDDKVDE